MRVRELAELVAATFEGDGEKRVAGAAPIDSAGAEDITFVANMKMAEQAAASAAGCLVAPLEFPNPGNRTLIRVAHPRAAFASILTRMYPRQPMRAGIHPLATVSGSAFVAESSSVGPFAFIGPYARVGERTAIGSGCSIGERSVIGDDCSLYSSVTVYDNARIGDRVTLHAGCVIGADGFGFVLQDRRYEKFPQVGVVVIGDDVEIGANSCVDRAALGVTVIGEGTKLDNMVHIGHNCRIGKHVVIAAQTGLSGGVIVEDYAVIGGQVGIGDKARIETRAVLGSGCGVLTSKIIRRGQVVWGTPARPLKEHLEQLANLSRLSDLRMEMAQLKARLQELERRAGLVE